MENSKTRANRRTLLTAGTLAAFLTVMAIGGCMNSNSDSSKSADAASAASAASAPSAASPAEPASASIDQGSSATDAPSTQGAEADQTPRLSDATDPSGIGQLFFGEVIAAGMNAHMKNDDQVVLLVTGALADAAGSDTSPEGILGAYKDAKIVSVENGMGTWQGRELPAALVRVQVNTVDRADGKYGKFCIEFAALKDKEFDYLRSPIYGYCDYHAKDLASQIQTWKQETLFQ